MEKALAGRTPQQQKAIDAFARRDPLSPRQRLELANSFGTRMGPMRAWATVKSYASGEMHEMGDDLIQITRAWLTLGERKFTVVFNVVYIVVKLAVMGGIEAFDDVIRLLKRALPRILVGVLNANWLRLTPRAVCASCPLPANLLIFPFYTAPDTIGGFLLNTILYNNIFLI